jgi:hypothetical protein
MTAITATPTTPVSTPTVPPPAPRRDAAVSARPRPRPDGKAVISDHTHPDT